MKIKISELLTRLIICCSLIMLAFTGVIGIERTKYFLFLIVGLCLLKTVNMRLTGMQLCALLMIALSLMLVFALHDATFANQLIFFASLIFAIDIYHKGIDEGTWNLLKICTVIACSWFVISSRSAGAWDQAGRLELSFGNPNMTGIALSAPTMILVIMAVEQKSKIIRVVYMGISAVMLYLIYSTENRGSFLTVIAFSVCAILALGKKKSWRITNKWIYWVFKLLPIIIMVVYVFLYSVLPNDLELLGKPFFSGRELGWRIALERLAYEPFTYHNFEDGMLNLFLEGMQRYGIFAMIGYIWILFTFKKQNLKELSVRAYLAYLGFHIFFFQQSFESTLITGSYSAYVWSYILLGVASMKESGGEVKPYPKDINRLSPME